MLVCWREGGGACLCVRRNVRVCVRACHDVDVMSEGGCQSHTVTLACVILEHQRARTPNLRTCVTVCDSPFPLLPLLSDRNEFSFKSMFAI